YTDLLLHDLGEKNDDVLVDGKAKGSQWRTFALWGLRFRARFLHDERAGSIEEVMSFHGGEAAERSDRFKKLPKADQQRLIAFLQSL
ncbi:MAG: di-heme oxidoredictase family protein, partial [Myxococcota bacterium]|nr:di-heme oxidoredictase family protein [Myxococcota bacterium]